MSSGSEVFLAYAFLTTTLTGDATLMGLVTGVFRAYAPPATVPPWIILQHQSGSDTTTMNGFRVFDELLMQCKVVGPASMIVMLASVAARFDVLLGGPPSLPVQSGPVIINSVIVGNVSSCYRQSPLHVSEIINGELWDSLGGLYRMHVAQTF